MSTTDTDRDIPTPASTNTFRRRWMRISLALVVVLVVLPAAWFVYQQAVQPDAPSSFYAPPANAPSGPGHVIRSETVRSGSEQIRVWRVLHTSTDATGAPIVVSATVAAPAGAAPAGGWPIVAWAHGTTGIVPDCAPSLDPDGGVGRIPGFEELVATGRVVVATDYEGLGVPGLHPYLIGNSEGHTVLDSIRAARALLAGQASSDAVIFGHSQGGHAVLFAAGLAAAYAPELHIVGAAAMAPPTDLSTLLNDDKAEPAGIELTALAIASWSKLYPQAHEDAVVRPEARPLVARVGALCAPATETDVIASVPDLLALKLGFLSANPADVPGWSELLAGNSPGTTVLPVPMLVEQGLADTLVRPQVTEAYIAAQCAAGANIETDTYAGVGHFQLRTVGEPAVIAWLQARLAGTPSAGGCTTEARPGS